MKFRTVLLGVGLGLFPTAVSAQQDSVMLEAVRLATEGRHDSASVLIRNRLSATSQSDPHYAEILFTAGRISTNREQAVQYFRQVSIEYANTGWADRALLNIAQLAYGAGDAQGALRASQRVLLDYPLSEVRAEASYIAARAHFDLRNPEEGCRLLGESRNAAGGNVELANRASFFIQRCDALAESASTETGRSGQNSDLYSVQVAAVSSISAADEMLSSLRVAGYEAHLVRADDGLIKIRVGRFRQRGDADRMAADIKGKLGLQPFVVQGN